MSNNQELLNQIKSELNKPNVDTSGLSNELLTSLLKQLKDNSRLKLEASIKRLSWLLVGSQFELVFQEHVDSESHWVVYDGTQALAKLIQVGSSISVFAMDGSELAIPIVDYDDYDAYVLFLVGSVYLTLLDTLPFFVFMNTVRNRLDTLNISESKVLNALLDLTMYLDHTVYDSHMEVHADTGLTKVDISDARLFKKHSSTYEYAINNYGIYKDYANHLEGETTGTPSNEYVQIGFFGRLTNKENTDVDLVFDCSRSTDFSDRRDNRGSVFRETFHCFPLRYEEVSVATANATTDGSGQEDTEVLGVEHEQSNEQETIHDSPSKDQRDDEEVPSDHSSKQNESGQTATTNEEEDGQLEKLLDEIAKDDSVVELDMSVKGTVEDLLPTFEENRKSQRLQLLEKVYPQVVQVYKEHHITKTFSKLYPKLEEFDEELVLDDESQFKKVTFVSFITENIVDNVLKLGASNLGTVDINQEITQWIFNLALTNWNDKILEGDIEPLNSVVKDWVNDLSLPTTILRFIREADGKQVPLRRISSDVYDVLKPNHSVDYKELRERLNTFDLFSKLQEGLNVSMSSDKSGYEAVKFSKSAKENTTHVAVSTRVCEDGIYITSMYFNLEEGQATAEVDAISRFSFTSKKEWVGAVLTLNNILTPRVEKTA